MGGSGIRVSKVFLVQTNEGHLSAEVRYSSLQKFSYQETYKTAAVLRVSFLSDIYHTEQQGHGHYRFL